MTEIPDPLASLPLVQALLDRRSRRFAAGFRLNGGPLASDSRRGPAAPTFDEEAALAFAATGVTGHALSELPFGTGDRTDAGGGHIMVHFVGRTVASGDAMHLAAVFVVNDEGAWMLRRPKDVLPGGKRPGGQECCERVFRQLGFCRAYAPSTSLDVVAPVTAKAFEATHLGLNSTTSLSFTLTNPAANAVALTGVAFTDTLQGGPGRGHA